MDLDYDKLDQEAKEAAEQKALFGVAGTALQGMADAPSFYELYKGRKSSGPNIKAGFDAVAGSIQDPREKAMKYMAMRKGQNEINTIEDADKAKSIASDPMSNDSMGARAWAKKNGLDIADNASKADIERVYGPLKDLVNKKMQSQTEFENSIAKMREEQRFRSSENEKDRLAKKEETEGRSSEGQKSIDKAFGQDFNEWNSRGRSTLSKNLDRLKRVKATLKEREDDFVGTSGRMTGRLPDWLRSEESVRLREDVQAAAQGALRATLGAQFTEKEGERIMNAAYNEKLSPAENIRKIDDAIKELAANAKSMDDRGQYFERNRGSLAGWAAPKGSSAIASGSSSPQRSEGNIARAADRAILKKQYSPSRNQTRITYSDGSTEVVDGQQ